MNSRWEIPTKPLMDEECFECGDIGECHQHHVVPKSVGGARTVLLCLKCHALVHDRHHFSTRALTRAGMRRAKLLGKTFGRKTVVTDEQFNKAKDMYTKWFEGRAARISVTKLSAYLGLSLGTASRLRTRVLSELL